MNGITQTVYFLLYENVCIEEHVTNDELTRCLI